MYLGFFPSFFFDCLFTLFTPRSNCFLSFAGANMDAGKLFALKKKKGKAQAQKKDPSAQQPVEAFFQKEIPEPSTVATVAGVVEGATKKKKGSKGVEPPANK
ncbi:unnamed protein product [Cuscuta europaea]|uniref:Uncharacterized protein n=1 Tax=Cuscuta europaea TaxID=41803 RepID=A0A9P0ZTW9_CUSEU|nr:unnamed protein product [Cuscuta europaea]